MKEKKENNEYEFQRGNYRIKLTNNEVLIQGMHGGQASDHINLSQIAVEIVGIQRHDNLWFVVLITPNAVKKIQSQLDDKLNLISFEFEKLEDAVYIQNLLVLHLLAKN